VRDPGRPGMRRRPEEGGEVIDPLVLTAHGTEVGRDATELALGIPELSLVRGGLSMCWPHGSAFSARGSGSSGPASCWRGPPGPCCSSIGPRLLAVKRRGLREYGVLGTGYVRQFDTKWL
jgi:hypothetical protein